MGTPEPYYSRDYNHRLLLPGFLRKPPDTCWTRNGARVVVACASLTLLLLDQTGPTVTPTELSPWLGEAIFGLLINAHNPLQKGNESGWVLISTLSLAAADGGGAGTLAPDLRNGLKSREPAGAALSRLVTRASEENAGRHDNTYWNGLPGRSRKPRGGTTTLAGTDSLGDRGNCGAARKHSLERTLWYLACRVQ
ncbi:hypothetical protein PAMA_002835 [Pampus argenteus]